MRLIAYLHLVLLLSSPFVFSEVPVYPTAPREDVVDVYHGVEVADPFRPLEYAESPATREFIDQQNAITNGYIDGAAKQRWLDRLTQLVNYPRSSAPRKHGQYWYQSRNDGLQNHNVVYVGQTPDALDRVLFDPNAWSKDGTVALSGTMPSLDGSITAYATSEGGSDDQVIRFVRTATGEKLPEELINMRFAGVTIAPDNSGYWFNQLPDPATVPASQQRRNMRLYWRPFGSDERATVFIPKDPDYGVGAGLTDDGRFLILYSDKGTSPHNQLFAMDLQARPRMIRQLFDDDAFYNLVGNVGTTLYVLTDKDAPRRKLISFDLYSPQDVTVVLPEGQAVIDDVTISRDHLVVRQTVDAASRLTLHDLDGKRVSEIPLPTVGYAGVTGGQDQRELFITFTSFTYPSSVFTYDWTANDLRPYFQPDVDFDPTQYVTREVFVTSKDGTRVPLFITHRKGLEMDGTNPTILYGYGGFRVGMVPYFSSSRVAWMERGGVLAVACIRGGDEYGSAWHEAGMLAEKQNVFDDFIACGKWLCDNRYTRPAKLAIEGGSNGGLLVAACALQAPRQFGAVHCAVGVLDMLRYHRWGTGEYWISEYGNADNSEKEFRYLLAYSPLHNIQDNTLYPPMLITTADGDDRVVPAHSFKFVATMQAASPQSLTLLRHDTRSGHGGGKPLAKQLEESADVYTFLLQALDEAP